jgi:hypothetical protein
MQAQVLASHCVSEGQKQAKQTAAQLISTA